jgi:hypothetical protein
MSFGVAVNSYSRRGEAPQLRVDADTIDGASTRHEAASEASTVCVFETVPMGAAICRLVPTDSSVTVSCTPVSMVVKLLSPSDAG